MALTNKGRFKIGQTEFRAKSIMQTSDSLASAASGRDDDGVMHLSLIQSCLRKWEIEMPPCTPAEASLILSAVQGREYTLSIWDINTNAEVSVTCYTTNSKSECYSGVLNNGTGLWQGISFSAIEVGTKQDV